MGFYADVSAALADSCVHYWALDEETGSTLADSINGFDFAQSNASYTSSIDATSVPTPIGRGRDLALGGDTSAANYTTYKAPFNDAQADAWTSSADGRNFQTSEFSVRFRVYLKSTSADWVYLFRTNAVSQSSVIFYVEPNTNKVNVYNSTFDEYSTAALALNQWSEIVFTMSAANGGRLYINGALDSTTGSCLLKPYFGADWYLGGAVSAPLDGIVDELSYWNRELSAGEVSSINGSALIGSAPAPSRVLYSDTAAALADNCLHYWRMDASEGANTITDSIGGYDGAVAPSFDVNGAVLVEATPMKEGRRIHFYTGMGTSDNAVLYCDPVAAGETSTQFWNASFRIRVKYDSINASGAMAASIGDRNSDLGSLAIYIRDLGSQPTCKWSRPNNPITGNIVDGSEWLEIVATSEGDSNGCTLRLYVNGLEIGSSVTGANRGGLNPYSQPIAFGGEYPVTVYSSDGVVDEAVFWSRTLSPTEISDLYNSGDSKFILPTLITAERALEASWNVVNGVDYYLATSWNVESANYVYPPEVDLGKISETVRFRAILEGANDSLSDIEIPISSFNARLRSARDSYLSITAPSASALVPDIEARPNGELVVQQVEGDQITELARVNFQDLRVDKGAKAGTTLTLSGYKQKTYEAPSAWSIQNHSYFSRSGSKSRVRLQANSRIRPQDQITVEGLSFIIDTVTLIGSTSRVFMELSE